MTFVISVIYRVPVEATIKYVHNLSMMIIIYVALINYNYEMLMTQIIHPGSSGGAILRYARRRAHGYFCN